MILGSDISSWQYVPSSATQTELVTALEEGKVVYFPNLSFELLQEEKALLTPAILNKKSKNISYNIQKDLIKGSILCHNQYRHNHTNDNRYNNASFSPSFRKPLSNLSYSYHSLHEMMARYAQITHALLNNLIPSYTTHIESGRTSYRPAEIKGRARSIRQDDTRLHVDAFPTTPTQGKRILRVFTNINPNNKPRIWNLGEPFEEVVKQFKTELTKPILGLRSLLYCLKLTKSYRSLYDHYMLQLHNKMKESNYYQDRIRKLEQHFVAGSTWIVMTDQVSHAALGGQYLLEQTFYLPVQAMSDPKRSPIKILERHLHTELFGT